MEYPRAILTRKKDPEVLEIVEDDLVTDFMGEIHVPGRIPAIIETRGKGGFKYKSLFLSEKYDYRLVIDAEEQLCLLVLRKSD